MNCILRSALHSECTFSCQICVTPSETKLLWKHPLISHFASVYLCFILTWNIFPPNLCVWQYVCACTFLFFPLFCVCDGNFVCFLKYALHSIVWECLGFSCSFVNVFVFKYHTLEIINPQQDSKCHVGVGKVVYLTLWVEKHWDNVLSIV